ncbi:MAG: sugar nucleotide-binding protein [Candidatus Pacearchaeota archaeon]
MKKQKILILGHRGMLGHKVFDYFSKEKTLKVLKSDFNIYTQKKEFENYVIREKPEIAINCIGLIKPVCEKSTREEIIYINALFPHILKKMVNEYGGKVIQISTDCVFDGKKGNYRVDESYSAKDLYGMSKALGEIIDEKNLTIRTSIIGREIGPNKKSLVEWFLQQKECNGFLNHKWNGVTTDYLAELILDIIKNEKNLMGIQQVASITSVSKYELLCLLKKRYNLSTIINPIDAKEAIDRTLIPTIPTPPIAELIEKMT